MLILGEWRSKVGGAPLKRKIFKAISIVAASGNAVAPAAAIPRTVTDAVELVAYQTAIAAGSPLHIQEFLTKYPASPLLGTAFGQIMQQIQPKTLRESVGTAGILYVQYGSGNSLGGDRMIEEPAAPPVKVKPGAVSAAQAQRTLDQVSKASGRLQSEASRCERNDSLNNCLGLALSYYANSLSSPKVVLPPQLKSIPKLVRRTASTVRTAKTAQVARQAVQQAVAEIRKQIKLLQVADDSRAGKLEVRAGSLVAASLTSIGDKLRQAEL